MKNGLSAMKYIKNNKRSTAVLFTALALTFMAMYVVNYLIMTTVESFKPIMLELPKKVSYAYITPETFGIEEYTGDKEDEAYEKYVEHVKEVKGDFKDKLKNVEGIDGVQYSQVINLNYSGIIGEIYYEAPIYDEPEDVKKYIDHMDAELIEGEMPDAPGEMLIDSVVMKNNGWKLGDNVRPESFGDSFKVVGVIKTDVMANVGLANGTSNNGWYYVILNDENTADLKKVLSDIGMEVTENDDIVDSLVYKGFYEKDVQDTISGAINVVTIVVMVFLAVSVIVAYVSFMRNRIGEYCLYSSIGYSRKSIYGMIMREMIIIFAGGLIVGMLISLVLMGVFDAGAIHPKGLVSKWFYPQHMLKILASIVCITGVLQIPILITINSIKTIDLVEE